MSVLLFYSSSSSRCDVETISPWPFPVCDRNQSHSVRQQSQPLSRFFLLAAAFADDGNDAAASAAAAAEAAATLITVGRSSSSNPPKAIELWFRYLPDWTGAEISPWQVCQRKGYRGWVYLPVNVAPTQPNDLKADSSGHSAT